MSPVDPVSFLLHGVLDLSYQDLTPPLFYFMGTASKGHSWLYMLISIAFGIIFFRITLAVFTMVIGRVLKKRKRMQVSFDTSPKLQVCQKSKKKVKLEVEEDDLNLAAESGIGTNAKKFGQNSYAQLSNLSSNYAKNQFTVKNAGKTMSDKCNHYISSMTYEKPAFIKGDIDIDPEKCQGFFSRGSITFKASTTPGEPSKLSIEYDEEMSKLIKKIVTKKSRYSFIFLKRSVGITEEHFGLLAVGVCLSICIFAIAITRRNQ